MAEKTYYEILGVKRDATEDEIKRAFRKLAAQNHPDAGGDEEAFKKISEAYTTLSDAEKRKEYDQMLMFGAVGGGQDPYGWGAGTGASYDPRTNTYTYTSTGGAGGFGGWSSIFDGDFDFSSIFSGMGGSRAGATQQTAGSAAASGGTRTDAGFGDFGNYQTRSHQGKDHVLALTVSFDDAFFGATKRITYTSAATGEEKPLTVKIPAGAMNGGKLRYRGRGYPGTNGGASGDLVIITRIAEHPLFSRQGKDVSLELPISIYEAALGATIAVPTPNHKTIKLKVPAGSQTGKRFRIKEAGAPDVKKPDQADMRGSLYVTLKVEVPTQLSAKDKATLEDLMQHDTHAYREEFKQYGA